MNFFLLNYFSVPQVLVLNDCNIDKAGDSEDLKKKCDSVKELDLAQNKLQSWNEVIIFDEAVFFYHEFFNVK